MSKNRNESSEESTSSTKNSVRVFGSNVTIYSDQFKATVEKMVRNDAFNENDERLIELEHTHLFRTFDSDGKRQTHAQSVGGHTHEIKWEQTPDGAAKIVSVSPPLKPVRKKVRGKFVIEFVKANDYDHHSHEFNYVKSDQVEARRANAGAAQFIGAEAAKLSKIPGVIG